MAHGLDAEQPEAGEDGAPRLPGQGQGMPGVLVLGAGEGAPGCRAMRPQR